MKKKLLKRPLLAYASGMKGDVYGYDYDSTKWILTTGLGIVATGVGLVCLFTPAAPLVVGALGTSIGLHATAFGIWGGDEDDD